MEVVDDAGAEGAGGGGDDPVAGFGCEEEERGILAGVADGVCERFFAEAGGEAHAGGDGGDEIEWVAGAGGVGCGGGGWGWRDAGAFETGGNEGDGLFGGVRGGLGGGFGCGHRVIDVGRWISTRFKMSNFGSDFFAQPLRHELTRLKWSTNLNP